MGGTFQAEERYRSGVGYWSFSCDKFQKEQNDLANSVDCGVWRLPPTDSTTGDAEYTEWAPGPRHYDDVRVTFLMNNKSQGLFDLAKNLGRGANKSANRFNFTLQFKNVDGTGYMRLNYLDAVIVGYTHDGYVSTASGEAATETIVFRSNNAKCEKG